MGAPKNNCLVRRMRAKVDKISYRDSSENEPVLFDNGVFLKRHLLTNIFLYGDETTSDIRSQKLSLELTIDFFGRKYKRDGEIECVVDDVEVIDEKRMTPLCVPIADNFNLKELEKRSGMRRVAITIAPVEFKKKLLELIPDMEMGFYLSEDELVGMVRTFLETKYSHIHFKYQTEIDGCIADGLAFVGGDYKAKIIGFEVKTDKDVFDRLYNQLDSYLTICDEVYLVVQSKKPPKDLPFYVGVLVIENGTLVMRRKASSMKHSIDVNDCWKTLLKNLSAHAGIKRDSDLIGFFETFESIKRKLVWNQFVIGFRQSYVAEYIPLSDEEKRLVRSYFGAQRKLDDTTAPEYDPALRLRSFDGFL